MGVRSVTFTQYYIKCDVCGCEDVVADNKTEHIHSKRQAIKLAGMHTTKDGRILCDDCVKNKK